MLEKIELSLDYAKDKDHAKAHAQLTRKNNVIIYLPTLTRFLSIPREHFPFHGIEEMIEELVIHELLHAIFPDVIDCDFFDSWHMLDCRLRNNFQRCNCPIDCYFRDCLTKEKIKE